MKKFSIRTLFVLLLALVLVFSLVACGDKDNDGGNNGGGNPPPTPDDNTTKTIAYFNNLWNLTKGIGGDTITENDNVALHFDMSLALATETRQARSINKLTSVSPSISCLTRPARTAVQRLQRSECTILPATKPGSPFTCS